MLKRHAKTLKTAHKAPKGLSFRHKERAHHAILRRLSGESKRQDDVNRQKCSRQQPKCKRDMDALRLGELHAKSAREQSGDRQPDEDRPNAALAPCRTPAIGADDRDPGHEHGDAAAKDNSAQRKCDRKSGQRCQQLDPLARPRRRGPTARRVLWRTGPLHQFADLHGITSKLLIAPPSPLALIEHPPLRRQEHRSAKLRLGTLQFAELLQARDEPGTLERLNEGGMIGGELRAFLGIIECRQRGSGLVGPALGSRRQEGPWHGRDPEHDGQCSGEQRGLNAELSRANGRRDLGSVDMCLGEVALQFINPPVAAVREEPVEHGCAMGRDRRQDRSGRDPRSTLERKRGDLAQQEERRTRGRRRGIRDGAIEQLHAAIALDPHLVDSQPRRKGPILLGDAELLDQLIEQESGIGPGKGTVRLNRVCERPAERRGKRGPVKRLPGPIEPARDRGFNEMSTVRASARSSPTHTCSPV
jgi:hypothetical protein